MKKTVVSILGWYGVVAIIGAYTLVSFDVIGTHSYTYQLLNLSGALGIIVEASAKKDTQPVVLNIVWAVVAVAAIIQLFMQ